MRTKIETQASQDTSVSPKNIDSKPTAGTIRTQTIEVEKVEKAEKAEKVVNKTSPTKHSKKKCIY